MIDVEISPVTSQDAAAASELHDKWADLQRDINLLSHQSTEAGCRLYEAQEVTAKAAALFVSDKDTPLSQIRREQAALRCASLRLRWRRDLILVEQALEKVGRELEELKAYAELGHVLSKCSE